MYTWTCFPPEHVLRHSVTLSVVAASPLLPQKRGASDGGIGLPVDPAPTRGGPVRPEHQTEFRCTALISVVLMETGLGTHIGC